MWRNLVVAAFLGGFGVGIARPEPDRGHRQSAHPLFALEPTVIAVASDIGQFGPTSGAPNGILGINPFGEDEEQPGPALAVLVMIGWAGLAFGAAAARLERRDLV